MTCRLFFRLVSLACLLGGDGAAWAQGDDEDERLPAFDFLYGRNELFPSALVCFTEQSGKAPADSAQLGDTRGVISVRLRAPRDNALVRVTLSETVLFEESHVNVSLPRQGEVYRVAPVVRYRIEKLAAQKQPLANLVIQARVEFPEATGPERTPVELTAKIVVHSINDAIQRYTFRDPPESGSLWNIEAKYMIAAYVNENNPWIDQRITRHALDHYIGSFSGYLTNAADVRKQAEAVYTTLRDFGFRYSRFPEASAAALAGRRRLRVQSVRLPGDSLLAAQANATEAALLLASVFQKMDMDTILLILPDVPSGQESEDPTPTRTLLGLYLKPLKNPSSLVVIDTRNLGELDFAAALKSGEDLLTPTARNNLFIYGPEEKTLREKAEEQGYFAIDIGLARQSGILPIPEVRRELPPIGRPEFSPAVVLPAVSRVSSFSLLEWLPSDNVIILGTIVIVALILILGLRKKKT